MVRRALTQRLLVAVAAAGVALFAINQTASAQGIYVFVGGAGTFPTSDFGDYAKTGWMAFGGVGVDVGPQGLSVGADLFYGQNNHEGTDILEGEKTTPYGAMGYVSYGFQTAGKITPYVFGGAGVLIHKFSATGVDSESETQFGYEGGVGVDFMVAPKISIFGEGRYIGSKDTQFFFAGAGLSFMVGG